MAKVIIVGAGPIGLLTAIQIMLYHPELTIELFEKYKEYTRKHTLNVEGSSFKGAHPDPRLQKLIENYHGQVPTLKIERELKGLAEELGIIITYREIKDVHALLKEQSDAILCIGADGSHSVVRNTFFANKNEDNPTDPGIPYQNLQYLLELKGAVSGNLPRLDWTQNALGLFHVQRFMIENVGKYDETQGTTPYTLRMFITEDEFQGLRGPDSENPRATFKNPLNLVSMGPIVPHLAIEFNKWLGYRKTVKSDFQVLNGSVTTTNLPAYTSNAYVHEEGKQKVCLVGDAALGIPYFRSFNVGVTGSIKLAQTIYQYLADEIEDLSPYDEFMHRTAGAEIFRARVKGTKIGMGDSLFYSSRVTSDASSAFVNNAVHKKISFAYGHKEHGDDDELSSSSGKKCVLQ